MVHRMSMAERVPSCGFRTPIVISFFLAGQGGVINATISRCKSALIEANHGR